MRLGQTSVVYLVSKFTGSVLGFIATIYFTRTLGEEIYGFYALTLAVVSWLGIVKTVGFSQAMIKRMSEGEETDAYLTAGIAIQAFLTLAVVVGVFVFREQLNEYVGQPVTAFVVILLFVSVFSGLVNTALQGTHRVHVYAPLNTVKQGVKSVAMIVLVLLGWGLSGMLLGNAIGTAVVAAIGILIVGPRVSMPRWHHVTRLFAFAKFSWLGSIRKKVYSEVDILVLGFFVPAGLTGVYAIAYILTEFLDIFGSAIRTTLFPELSKLASDEDAEMIGTLTRDALAYAGLFLVPGLVGGTLLGDRVMRVYGPGFEIGATVLPILLVGILAYSYNKQLLNTLNAIDRPDLAFRANAVFIAVNLALNVLFVWRIGWTGAAVATALSAGIGLVLGFHYARTQVDFIVPFDEMAHQWIAALVMGVTVYVVRAAVETAHPWVDGYNTPFVALLVALGAGVYFLVLLAISSTFRDVVRRNLPVDLPTL